MDDERYDGNRGEQTDEIMALWCAAAAASPANTLPQPHVQFPHAVIWLPEGILLAGKVRLIKNRNRGVGATGMVRG